MIEAGDPTRPLRERLALDAACYGFELPDGTILLLTHRRAPALRFDDRLMRRWDSYPADDAGRMPLADSARESAA